MTDVVGIGALIAELSDEFPEVTISKVRFLEGQGLVTPARTPSGYRRYTTADRDRLRYVLSMQRDHFLPLKVIREHLDAIERGLQPPEVADPAPRPPAPRPMAFDAGDAAGLELSRAEVLRETGLAPAALREAEEQGLIAAGRLGTFDRNALDIARAVAGLAEYGLTPRHLRALRLAAEREIGLIEAVTTPMQGMADAEQRMRSAAVAVASLSADLQGALVRSHLAEVLP